MKNFLIAAALLAALGCSGTPNLDEMSPDTRRSTIDQMNSAGEPGAAPRSDVATIKQGLTQSFFTPFTAPAGVLAVVGTLSAYSNQQWLVFWRSTDFHCEWHQVGDASGLWGPVTVLGSHEAWGDFETPAWGQGKTVTCDGYSYTFTMPLQNSISNLITFQGFGTGNDYFNCSGDGAGCAAYGFGGNDVMETWQSNFTFYGGPGDDRLRTHAAWGSKSFMLGQDGNDCLQSDTTPPAWVNTLMQYDCDWAGMGGDSSSGDKSTGILGTHCNNLVPVGTCN